MDTLFNLDLATTADVDAWLDSLASGASLPHASPLLAPAAAPNFFPTIAFTEADFQTLMSAIPSPLPAHPLGSDESSADEASPSLASPTADDDKRKQLPTINVADDNINRDLFCAKALQQPSMASVFARVEADPMAHYLTKVYTNHKDESAPASGSRRRAPVDEPVSLFQSNRNCKRHVHAFLYLRMHYGSSVTITDAMLKTVWRHLEATCDYGVHHRTGHAISHTGNVCVNPYHYRWVETDAAPARRRRRSSPKH